MIFMMWLRTAKQVALQIKGKIDIAQDTLDVQEDLDSVIAWSMKNNMSLHEDKFIYFRYCTNKSTLLNELPFTAEYAEYDTTSGYALNPTESAKTSKYRCRQTIHGITI